MGQQQLAHPGLSCQPTRLSGGEVEPLSGQLGQLVGEGAFEAQQVDPLHVGQQGFVVDGVAAVGVRERGTGSGERGIWLARDFGDTEAIRGDGVHDGEGVDGAALVFEYPLLALVELHLGPFDRVFNMVAGELENGLYGLARSFGGYDGDRFGASAEVHGAEQSGKSEEVVAVEVRDQDGADGLQLDVVVPDAVLCAFGAVEQYLEPPQVEHLGAAMTCAGGQCGPRAQYGDVEVHDSFW